MQAIINSVCEYSIGPHLEFIPNIEGYCVSHEHFTTYALEIQVTADEAEKLQGIIMKEVACTLLLPFFTLIMHGMQQLRNKKQFKKLILKQNVTNIMTTTISIIDLCDTTDKTTCVTDNMMNQLLC